MNFKLMKNVLVIIFFMCCICLICVNTRVMATTQNNIVQAQDEAIIKMAGIDDIINAGNGFINKGSEGASAIAKDKDVDISPEGLAGEFLDIGTVLVAIGVVTLLIVSVIMAIRWITATPDKQAKLKEQLIGLVIATVVIFGAIGIWNFVQGIMKKVESQTVPTVNPDDSSIVHPQDKETTTTTITGN